MKRLKVTLFTGVAAACVGVSAPANAQAGTQFIGQVSAFGANFCPRDWADASGQLLPISSYTALFSLYGTIYGGDGRTTFALPDLRGRRPINQGNAPGLGSYTQGSRSGTTQFTLTQVNMPSHNHTGTLAASPTTANSPSPVRNSFAATTNGTNDYITGNPAINNMHPGILRLNNAGNGQSVSKVSPYQAVRWCVALNGIYPSRN